MKDSFFVHATAVVDEGCQLGEGTKVWHFTHLMSKAVIGANCIIGQNVFIDNDVIIGKGVKIQNNVSVYKGVTLEDDVFVGPSVVFTNVMNPRSFIERKDEFKTTVVREGATLGANATIVCGIEIGSYAFVGAGALVTKPVKAFALVYGQPAQQYGWVSKMGYRLNFNEKGEAKCEGNGEAYVLKKDYVFLSPLF
ncbi:MAG TPA: acyltransferase [Chitinophagaceae bacterium]|nr:acyltransferase [Chitinophagaceae bacterium]